MPPGRAPVKKRLTLDPPARLPYTMPPMENFHLVVHLSMQKRALSKDMHPGSWDTSVGGHVMAGESVGDEVRL